MSENIHDADHPVLVRMTKSQIQESLCDRVRAREYDELFLKLKRGLDLASAAAIGKVHSLRLPDGRDVRVPQETLGQRRAALGLAMREIKGFLAVAGFDEGLLQPLSWVMDAIDDAISGAKNPIFAPQSPANRGPITNDHAQIMGILCYATLLAAKTRHVTKKAAAKQLADLAAKAGIKADGEAITDGYILRTLFDVQKQDVTSPKRRSRNSIKDILRYFHTSQRLPEGRSAGEAYDMLVKSISERHGKTP